MLTNRPQLKLLIESFRDWGRDCWCEPGEDDTCGLRFEQQLGSLPHGYDHKYIYTHIGYNLKVTDMQAAIGVAQLASSDVRRSRAAIGNCSEGSEPFEDVLMLPRATEGSDPSWFGFPITVREEASFDRSELIRHLESQDRDQASVRRQPDPPARLRGARVPRRRRPARTATPS